ncbi:hypothetical protein [Salinimicrobium sp. TH3]|uniref:hypothetical protein n=1 Tax=Salinimicrobium sp. TH3 TaxID=2997342 RepID=UPI00227433D1|nr:hypothetical protein [Salinimicrobium sp. TH3]MCY2687340.1 hypothetical protein [Salinimicrobium sp. TH3]
MKITRLTGLMLTAALILLLPLVGMIFTSEVDWGLLDFVVMGILLFGTAFIIDLIFKKVRTTEKRIIYAAIVLGVLFLVWAELAVGIFGTPFAGS